MRNCVFCKNTKKYKTKTNVDLHDRFYIQTLSLAVNYRADLLLHGRMLTSELDQLWWRWHTPRQPLYIPRSTRRRRHCMGFRHPPIERHWWSERLVSKHLFREFIRLVIWITGIPINIHFHCSQYNTVSAKYLGIPTLPLPGRVFAFYINSRRYSYNNKLSTQLTADFLNHKLK